MQEVVHQEYDFVLGTLDFLLPPERHSDIGEVQVWQGPYLPTIEERLPQATFETVHHVKIRDIRSQQSDFNIRKNGFEFIFRPSRFRPTVTQQQTLGEYIIETTEFVKRHLSAHKVLCFDYRVRNPFA